MLLINVGSSYKDKTDVGSSDKRMEVKTIGQMYYLFYIKEIYFEYKGLFFTN